MDRWQTRKHHAMDSNTSQIVTIPEDEELQADVNASGLAEHRREREN